LKKFLSIALFLFLSTNHFAHGQFIKRLSPVGVYCKTEEYSGICLELRADHTYLYSSGTDLHTDSSSGKWQFNKDTILLNSSIQKNDLPISIEEVISKNSESLIFIPILKNFSKDLVKDAIIYVNEDTAKYCMPVFKNDCKFVKGSVNKIRIVLSNNISSKWYSLNDSNCDTLKITVNTKNYLDNYIFMKNLKFVISPKGIIPLEFINISNQKMKYKRQNYFLKRINS
jgi:hypothetical protein